MTTVNNLYQIRARRTVHKRPKTCETRAAPPIRLLLSLYPGLPQVLTIGANRREAGQDDSTEGIVGCPRLESPCRRLRPSMGVRIAPFLAQINACEWGGTWLDGRGLVSRTVRRNWLDEGRLRTLPI